MTRCWLAQHGVMERGEPMPACDGQLVRVHLIPRQKIRKAGGRELDCRSYVMACGGPMGSSGHHGHLDSSKRLRIPRSAIPAETLELALELNLGWWVDLTYL